MSYFLENKASFLQLNSTLRGSLTEPLVFIFIYRVQFCFVWKNKKLNIFVNFCIFNFKITAHCIWYKFYFMFLLHDIYIYILFLSSLHQCYQNQIRLVGSIRKTGNWLLVWFGLSKKSSWQKIGPLFFELGGSTRNWLSHPGLADTIYAEKEGRWPNAIHFSEKIMPAQKKKKKIRKKLRGQWNSMLFTFGIECVIASWKEAAESNKQPKKTKE